MKKNNAANRATGISANALVMPIVMTLSVLHIMIIVVILMVNSSSGKMSTIMRNSGAYTQEVTSLLAGSSLLADSSNNFVMMPTTETGEINVFPMKAYAGELARDRRGQQVLERFRSFDVTPEELACVEEAAKSADFLLETQIHAISLMRSVYPLPEIQPLTQIPLVALTEEELAMTDAQRESAARALLLSSVYALNKQTVSEQVNACAEMLQSASARMAAETAKRIMILRTILWVVTLSIIVILIGTFMALYRKMLFPLGHFVRQIPENVALDEKKGFREIRLLAAAYNDVLMRRDALDTILRSAAETDALTNLPNRYRFEQYMLESGDSGYSMAVLLFDVNYLKKTNDTKGHLAGDQLIRTAAECISSCFGENCFRFGGDEFAAIVKDCTPEAIDQMVARFEETEKSQNISVSLGYAYAEEIGQTTFRKLLDEADKKMYAQKQEKHRDVSGDRDT